MYAALIAILFILSAGLLVDGARRRSVWPAVLGVIVAAGTVAFFWFLGFWGEALWFEAVGYPNRFWKVVITRVLLMLAGAAVAIGLVHVLMLAVPKGNRYLRIGSKLLAAYIGGYWGLSVWDTVLLYLNRVGTDVKDPILGRDVGFYLFVLPLYDSVYLLLLGIILIALAASAAAVFVGFGERGLELRSPRRIQFAPSNQYRALYWSTAALLVLLAWGRYLSRFHLMYSQSGVVIGPGWTDVHIRLPLYWVMLVLLLAGAVLLFVGPLRRIFTRWTDRTGIDASLSPASPLLAVAVGLGAAWLILLAVAPALSQWLYVQPNEITVERPYLVNNIAFTRRAFALHEMVEKDFPVAESFTRDMVQGNEGIFNNIRLWDWRALDAVYEQFQVIRLYYQFADVDVDRYTIADNYRQVMISAREMELANLSPQSQTFVNRRFKYTHGFGIAMVTVNEFTPEGLPHFLVKDIPPESAYKSLEVERPSIYYGELTRTHVIVNTREQEFHYPRGEDNVYIRYPGTGGVQIHNLWRKFLFGWKFDGTRLFFSQYPTAESRIMFHRRIQERVRLIAPFLRFDDDPYVVLAGGRLYWIVDAYTTSSGYPYSEPFYAQVAAKYRPDRNLFDGRGTRLRGINYIRNSVKIVVDAFEGSVDLYVFAPDDPLIRAWQRVFPDLFRSAAEMPPGLLPHIRYPSDLLLIQGLVYTKYHMTDPVVFYNQEDLWVRATEKYYGEVQFVQPYYIMWEAPETNQLEFVLMLPFTPKNRQVLIGWIAGRCDPPNYGRLIAYKFPKEKRVLGTQQMETKIDQDPYLSAQLSLWDQRGSRVIRGNVLVIPVEDTLIYVEPIYLQAETAAYPELRLVTIMHNDQLSYAPRFEEALEGLLLKGEEQPPSAVLPAQASVKQLIQQANEAFEGYLQALGAQEFQRAATQLETLQGALQKLSKTVLPGEPGSEPIPGIPRPPERD